MFPWMFPWPDLNKWPLSGNVTQDISPITSWFSPQLEVNFAGNRQLEGSVVADVASYGKQLGIVSEALLEVAHGEKGSAVEKLEALVKQIEAVKQQHKHALGSQVKAGLEELKQKDPDLLKQLLREYADPVKSP
ncbi:hypothetical protein R50073_08750 [Maricurvus nonylphenolicus]|uniref:hypothetical protein n=1 Tax=Maricurvus nonylphenolicus TaxID=1008307 RepID=UPI0036F1F765